MSRIIIHPYDGDAESYDWDQADTPENIGEREPSIEYTDGEDLDAVGKIVELINQGKHFDVRQWVN